MYMYVLLLVWQYWQKEGQCFVKGDENAQFIEGKHFIPLLVLTSTTLQLYMYIGTMLMCTQFQFKLPIQQN